MIVGPAITIIGVCALIAVLGIPIKGMGIGIALGFGLYLFWRVSIAFGPMKKCWRCKGGGSVGGLFGGRRKCPSCGGSGLRPRVGSR